MNRATWTRFRIQEGNPVQIDLELTPLRGVARDASVIAATARRSSSASCEIEIVRYDAADEPTPYNIDRYTVYEQMPSHQSFNAIIEGGSTADNANLRSYLLENVFIVKQHPGPDHWMASPPSSSLSVFRSS